MKKRIILFAILFFIVVGCAKTQTKENCLDGKGKTVYFPNSNGDIKFKNWQIKVPEEVWNLRVAYISINDCSRNITYFIKFNNFLENVSEQGFYDYVRNYNSSCKCLEVYDSGY